MAGFSYCHAPKMLVKANRPVPVHSICGSYVASYDKKYVYLRIRQNGFFCRGEGHGFFALCRGALSIFVTWNYKYSMYIDVPGHAVAQLVEALRYK